MKTELLQRQALTMKTKGKKGPQPSTLIVFATFSTDKKGNKSQNNVSLPELKDNVSIRLNKYIDEKIFAGKNQEYFLLRDVNCDGYANLLLIGLGDEKLLSAEKIRLAVGGLSQFLKTQKIGRALLDVESIKSVDTSLAIKALTEGILLGAYEFNELKSDKKNADSNKVTLLVENESEEILQGYKEGLVVAECTNFAKRLGDLPGNFLTPSILAKEAQKASAGTGIKFEAWNLARIKKEKMGGLLCVNQGSKEEPRFIIMEYRGAGAKEKPFVLVGKGLTFDTGGISIKPSAHMDEMKYDMCGGAYVIGALLAIAKLKLKINAIALVPATDNMPSDTATKPGDVYTARNGKTFEVLNTDAEGRLILADALSYASELKPRAIIDAATLTGAMALALGNIHTGYFTRSDFFSQEIEKAGTRAGEAVWRMPLCDHHLDDIKGIVADISNISHHKGAGASTAAAFLEHFVEPGIPWAHFDIAGTAWAAGNRLSYVPKKGASGIMVRTFVELAKAASLKGNFAQE